MKILLIILIGVLAVHIKNLNKKISMTETRLEVSIQDNNELAREIAKLKYEQLRDIIKEATQ